MQHERHRVPVTALAFFRRNIILAGEGNYLKLYSADSRLLKSICAFESQAIHGVIVDDANFIILAWGGSLSRSVSIRLGDNCGPPNLLQDALVTLDCVPDSLDEPCCGDLDVTLGEVYDVQDWILHAAFAPRAAYGPSLAALVTAHNALWVAKLSHTALTRKCSTTVDLVLSGSNCILYSAHIRWMSELHCVIASGTAFGDVIVWSATLNNDGGELRAASQTHYNFAAHEGSVFGVQLSQPLVLPGSNNETRLLASCSDDRSIRVWDIEDASAQLSTPDRISCDTGFGERPKAGSTPAPLCLAKTMGHISRIWSIRYLTDESPGRSSGRHDCSGQRVVSFGEDATAITWALIPNNSIHVGSSCLPYRLEQVGTATAHSGKNIWSVAVGTGHLCTGGADGTIALYLPLCYDDDISEIPNSLLNQSTGSDHYRTYCFVADGVLLSTTDQGRIVLIDLPRLDGTLAVHHVSGQLPGLRGYSVTSGVPGMGFIAGNDGAVYIYIHRQQSLSKIFKGDRKTAGLFACNLGPQSTALLITTVGAARAQLMLLEDQRESGESRNTCISSIELPVDFVATSFTCNVTQGTGLAVLGSRDGSMAVYGPVSSGHTEPVALLQLRKTAHGKEAVTALHWEHGGMAEASRHWIFSVGRDGTFALHSLMTSGPSYDMALVHQFSLPFGPNIEGLCVSAEHQVHVWGFRSKSFIAYDVTAQKNVMTVECGGAHRNWAFQPSQTGGTFVWTKASKLSSKKQFAPPYQSWNSGGHGREIKAAAVTPTHLKAPTADGPVAGIAAVVAAHDQLPALVLLIGPLPVIRPVVFWLK